MKNKTIYLYTIKDGDDAHYIVTSYGVDSFIEHYKGAKHIALFISQGIGVRSKNEAIKELDYCHSFWQALNVEIKTEEISIILPI